MRSLSLAFLLLAILSGSALGQSTPMKLTGQITCCAECWAKEDRRLVPYGNVQDREAAANCVAKGDPTLLAVMDSKGQTTFYVLAEGKFKRPERDWLPYVGDTVEITGTLRVINGAPHVEVDALRILSPAIADFEPQWEIAPEEIELALKSLSGVQQKLSSYRGRIIVLNFFATYCVPCRREMPALEAIQSEYAARGVQVIGVSADHLDFRPQVRQFTREMKINFPVWVGATAADMTRFGLMTVLPGTVVIGRDGKVITRIEGAADPTDLRKQIDALLAQTARQATGEASAAPPSEQNRADHSPTKDD